MLRQFWHTAQTSGHRMLVRQASLRVWTSHRREAGLRASAQLVCVQDSMVMAIAYFTAAAAAAASCEIGLLRRQTWWSAWGCHGIRRSAACKAQPAAMAPRLLSLLGMAT